VHRSVTSTTQIRCSTLGTHACRLLSYSTRFPRWTSQTVDEVNGMDSSEIDRNKLAARGLPHSQGCEPSTAHGRSTPPKKTQRGSPYLSLPLVPHSAQDSSLAAAGSCCSLQATQPRRSPAPHPSANQSPPPPISGASPRP
jgi:hypothetical protein